jgi:hypothetical protein
MPIDKTPVSFVAQGTGVPPDLGEQPREPDGSGEPIIA